MAATIIKAPAKRMWAYAPMTVLALFFLFPIVFMVAASLKTDHQIFADMNSVKAFLPVGELSLDNYAAVFDRVPFWRFLGNTLFVTFMVTALGLVVNSMCGYALARMRWKGRGLVFGLVIATLVLPFDTTIVPMVYLVANLPWIGFDGPTPVLEFGWLNTYRVQIVPFIVNAFSIFLFAQYFKSLPKGLEEAAAIDGAGWLRTLLAHHRSPLQARVRHRRDPDRGHLPGHLERLPVAAHDRPERRAAPRHGRRPVLLLARHRLGRGDGLHHHDHRADGGRLPRLPARVHPVHRRRRHEGLNSPH
ncbi:carbohydrate ABC transporter permease [Glycomyces niveus]|uniref:Carbohydrate ABC transporter permease n=1 Tax=Glycomyces niveus TaxID=2820287 RepID=A0ABS3U213_9ACTN|nr:carbohydrate ABC transporter permease [Glycomyces sp. NEAU-S30]MBO3731793.1 carbohydrate ABC transporter permease [Glycomyces sp. NEAU-S30]